MDKNLITRLRKVNDPLANEAADELERYIKAGEKLIVIFDKFGKACDDLVKETNNLWE